MRNLAIAFTVWGIAAVALAEEGPVHRWDLKGAGIKNAQLLPRTGNWTGMITGPIEISKDEPKVLLLRGDSKAKHGVEIADLSTVTLPTKALAIEAWVWVDRIQEWGGIAGAFQDNGAYEKGWILGFQNSQFFFAVASKGKPQLTYLKAKSGFHTGCWYHVVGCYDGVEQTLYVDGVLQARAKEQKGEIDYPPKGYLELAAYRDDNEHYSLAGRLERVSIFDRALSAETVAGLFKERKEEFPGIEPSRPLVLDWPTYQRDNRQSGIAIENIPLPLHLQWTHDNRSGPKPAWAEEAKTDYYHNRTNLPDRVIFDRAFHMVGVGNRVVFGSSSENLVVCLNADTGKTHWTFLTEGPIRLVPTIAGDHVVFGCDDGFVYSVALADGKLAWKTLAAPDTRRIPGNNRMISAWPVRTNVLVEEGKGYVCAGVFPSQGVEQLTLDLSDGTVLARKTVNVSAQGYLERVFGKLMVPTGRVPGSAFLTKLKASGKELGPEVNSLAKDYPYAFIGAGDVRFAGGDGKLAAFSAVDGQKLWSADVEGKVLSLAVLRGWLLASTDRGRIYCFGAKEVARAAAHVPSPLTELPTTKKDQQNVDRLIKQADLERGYCLVVGAGDGRLAYLLAQQTAWDIVVAESDADKAAALRQNIHEAGLTGRVSVQHVTLDPLPYSDYTFNVIVGDTGLGPRDEMMRVLRPHGGVAFMGTEDASVVRRGPLKGEGEWTHMYANPANTACSDDQLVGQELCLQWFGQPGPKAMIDRHHRTAPPVYKNGRLFIPGEDRVTGLDAYNGTILWEKDIPDSRRIAAFRDSSYLVVADEAVYVAAANTCLALDPRNGKLLKSRAVPDDPDGKQEWAYLARSGDLILGSAVKKGSIRREQSHKLTLTETHWDQVPAVGSTSLFAFPIKGERPAWTYRAEHGLIINPTITIGGDHVYLIESKNAKTLETPLSRGKLVDLLGSGSELVALNIATGKVAWRQDGARFADLRHNVFVLYSDNRLVVVGSRNSGTDNKPDRLWYDVHVLDATDGKHQWSHSQNQLQAVNGDHGEQERHPVVVGGKLYCEPLAYDLRSGEPIEWKWPWTAKRRSGCGTLSASSSCFYFRQNTASSFNLATGLIKPVTTETRPGCWINLIPAGGLVLAPEASSGCTCNYAVQTSLALIPVRPIKK